MGCLPVCRLFHGELDAAVRNLFFQREHPLHVCPVQMVLDHAVCTGVYTTADGQELLVLEVHVEPGQDYYEEGHDCCRGV